MSFITEAKDCESAYNVQILNQVFFDIAFRHKYAAYEFIQAKIWQIAFEYMPVQIILLTMFTEF
jgi:hypothetical protein